MTDTDLGALVRLLAEKTPLGNVSNMEGRVIFEFMLQKGYRIVPPPDENPALGQLSTEAVAT